MTRSVRFESLLIQLFVTWGWRHSHLRQGEHLTLRLALGELFVLRPETCPVGERFRFLTSFSRALLIGQKHTCGSAIVSGISLKCNAGHVTSWLTYYVHLFMTMLCWGRMTTIVLSLAAAIFDPVRALLSVALSRAQSSGAFLRESSINWTCSW